MCEIVGRDKEKEELKMLYNSKKAEFVAVYGRRRVGKTYLIDEVFRDKITFRHAGLSPIDKENNKNNLKQQLKHFYYSLQLHGMKKSHCPTSWLEAFFMLEQLLESRSGHKKQVIFLDELPWLDTPRSGFMTAFEGFWNTWACHRKNMLLVVCGSANSWMLDNLVNNHGGLYGRTTYEVKLKPFTLAECEKFYKSRNVKISRYDIVQSNMILGGIPYYLGYMKPGLSLAQNINQLFFSEKAQLHDEYNRLFSSIFVNPEEMKRIVEFLGTRRAGYTRQEILNNLQLEGSGNFSKMLNALIASDFIQQYIPFGKGKHQIHYKLVDPFCLFYMKYVQGKKDLEQNFWLHNIENQSIISWRGYAFEEVCLRHISQIKKALNILAVSSNQSAWSLRGDDDHEGSQIDLLIQRKDNIVNLCEMKFYSEEYVCTKSYHAKIQQRKNLLGPKIPKRCAIQSVLVTTFGLQYNEYSGAFDSVVTLNDLFD